MIVRFWSFDFQLSELGFLIISIVVMRFIRHYIIKFLTHRNLYDTHEMSLT